MTVDNVNPNTCTQAMFADSRIKSQIGNFASLPDEVLVMIFNCLPFKDVTQTVELVCRTWRDIARDPVCSHHHTLRKILWLCKAPSETKTYLNYPSYIWQEMRLFSTNNSMMGVYDGDHMSLLRTDLIWEPSTLMHECIDSKVLGIEDGKMFRLSQGGKHLHAINIKNNITTFVINLDTDIVGSFIHNNQLVIGNTHCALLYIDFTTTTVPFVTKTQNIKSSKPLIQATRMAQVGNILVFADSTTFIFYDLKKAHTRLYWNCIEPNFIYTNSSTFFVVTNNAGNNPKKIHTFEFSNENNTFQMHSWVMPRGFEDVPVSVLVDDRFVIISQNSHTQGIVLVLDAKTGEILYTTDLAFDPKMPMSYTKIKLGMTHTIHASLLTRLKGDFLFCMLANELQILHLPTRSLLPPVKLDPLTWFNDVELLDKEMIILAYERTIYKVFQRLLPEPKESSNLEPNDL